MNSRTTVMAFLVEVYAVRQKLSKGSIEQHRWIIDSLNAWNGEPVRLCELSAQLAVDWLHHLRRRGLKLVTVQNRRRHLLTLWAAAYRSGLIDMAPNIPSLAPRIVKSIARARAIHGDPSAEVGTGMLLRDYVHRYKVKRAIASTTVKQYEDAARSLDNWHGTPVRVDMLCDDLVNRWLMRLEDSPLATATIRGRRRHLISLWHSAFRDGLAAHRRGELRLIRLDQTPPEAWTHAEVCRLLDAASALRGYYPSKRWIEILHTRVKRSTFWELLIRIAWDTGLRGGDSLRLSVQQFDDDGIAEVIQGKTGRWHMTRVHPETLQAIRAGDGQSRERIIEWFNSHEWLRREFRKLVALAGIRNGTLKRLRKSSATDVELHHPGCGASHLGHVVPGSIAQAHYLDPRILIQKKPMPQPLRTLRKKGGAA